MKRTLAAGITSYISILPQLKFSVWTVRTYITYKYVTSVCYMYKMNWPNVFVCNSKIINATINISIFFERRCLQQFIEVIRWDLGPLKVVLITARSWETWSKWAFCDREFQLHAGIKNTFNHPRTFLMNFMNCWRSLFFKNMLIFVVRLILFDLQTKTFRKVCRFMTLGKSYQKCTFSK